MNLPLESLHSEHFQPLLDTSFLLVSGADTSFPLRLVEVRSLGHRRVEATRDPFALVLRGPAGLRVAQGIHKLEHPGTGRLEVFLVQLADRPDGSLFEVIFT